MRPNSSCRSRSGNGTWPAGKTFIICLQPGGVNLFSSIALKPRVGFGLRSISCGQIIMGHLLWSPFQLGLHAPTHRVVATLNDDEHGNEHLFISEFCWDSARPIGRSVRFSLAPCSDAPSAARMVRSNQGSRAARGVSVKQNGVPFGFTVEPDDWKKITERGDQIGLISWVG